MMYTFRLYFAVWEPACDVCVCGSVAISWAQLVYRLRAKYGVCFQTGRMVIVALGLDSLFECAL